MPILEYLLTQLYRYPKQHKLLALKQAAVEGQSHQPTHLPLASISSLQGMKFDVILVDPPYADTSRDPPYGGIAWDQIAELPIPALAADPSFIFLWVGHGNSDGLERGREVLAKWGFRRCEDIVWVKTNKTSNRGPGVSISSLLPSISAYLIP
jgi:mRNA m6A methyltransferase non-catalytic subunit